MVDLTGMTEGQKRQEKIFHLMDNLRKEAEQGRYELDLPLDEALDVVVASKTRSLREVLLVAAAGKLLDEGYKPSKVFYDKRSLSFYRKPRGVYPSIKVKLRQFGVPYTQDAPLNIAKGAPRLTAGWAAGRRDRAAAEALLNLLKQVDSTDEAGLRILAVALHAKLLNEAVRVAELTVEAKPEADPGTLHALCVRLITEAADGGNTPQRIVGCALMALDEELGAVVEVLGAEDRSSSTNTGGQKPGDIHEQLPDGSIAHVYEVSVKAFDEDRVAASFDSLKAYEARSGRQISEITVICRAQDSHPKAADGVASAGHLGKLEYGDVTYHFVDINDWIMSTLLRMPPTARLELYEKLHRYISDPNTNEVVKEAWAGLHSSLIAEG